MLALIRDEVAGDPTTGRRWIRRSLDKLSGELTKKGFQVGRNVIGRLLRKHDVEPKSNVNHLSPKEHPDRDRQFRYIKEQRAALSAGRVGRRSFEPELTVFEYAAATGRFLLVLEGATRTVAFFGERLLSPAIGILPGRG